MQNKLVPFTIVFTIATLIIGLVCVPFEAVNATDTQIIDDWPMYRHDAQRTGYTSSSVPLTNETRWIYNATTEFDSSPAIIHGRLIIGQSNGDVLAINTTTGRLLWSYSIAGGSNSIWCSPAVDSGRVYIGSRNDVMYCLNETTGELLWSYQTGNDIDSSPIVSEGRVYFGSYDKLFYSLNATSGTYLWSVNTTGGMFSAPSIVNGTVYLTHENSGAYALNAITGAIIWNVTIDANGWDYTYITTSPLYSDGKLYFGANKGVYCLNATNGNCLWTNSTAISVFRSSPALDNGRLFIGSEDGKLYCISPLNGSILWSYRTAGEIWGSPAVANGTVITGCGLSESRVYCINQTTGELIWSYFTGARSLSGPAICDGVVYAGCGSSGFLTTEGSGKIYAFGTRNLAPTNLTLNLNSASAYLGYQVNLTGTLTYSNGSAISGTQIELAYSINNGQTWNDITSTTTTANGDYLAVWAPSATGIYLVKATLNENYPYAKSEAATALSIALYNSQYVFSVESNSTVSSLTFNSTSNNLSFTVSGMSGTTGFLDVTIAKSLVSNINSLTISFDGNNMQYVVSSTSDSWIISITYAHSTHSVNINLGTTSSGSNSGSSSSSSSLSSSSSHSTGTSATPTPTPSVTISPSPTAPTQASSSPNTTNTTADFPWIYIVVILVIIISALMFLVLRQKRK